MTNVVEITETEMVAGFKCDRGFLHTNKSKFRFTRVDGVVDGITQDYVDGRRVYIKKHSHSYTTALTPRFAKLAKIVNASV